MGRQLALFEVKQAKRCSKCKQVKTTEEFYRHKKGRDGFGSQCKPCHAEINAERRARPEVKKRQREYMREYSPEYRAKPEVKARMKEYHRERDAKPVVKASKREWSREYYAKPEVRAHRRERERERLTKPEARARVRESQAKYNAKPEGKARRREWRSDPEVKARTAQLQRVKRTQKLTAPDGPCPYCGTLVSALIPKGQPGHGQIDHKIPRAKGGTDDPSNLQLTCAICNFAKSDLSDKEFRIHIGKMFVHLFLNHGVVKQAK